jgi:hypothetical protein
VRFRSREQAHHETLSRVLTGTATASNVAVSLSVRTLRSSPVLFATPDLLAGPSFDMTKRETADELILRLAVDEERYGRRAGAGPESGVQAGLATTTQSET